MFWFTTNVLSGILSIWIFTRNGALVVPVLLRFSIKYVFAGMYKIAWKLFMHGAEEFPAVHCAIIVYPLVWVLDVLNCTTTFVSYILKSQSNRYRPALEKKPTWSSIRVKKVPFEKSWIYPACEVIKYARTPVSPFFVVFALFIAKYVPGAL